jgi:prophage maintenance system killer protein
MAVVVDDRTDVWEAAALQQILVVVPHCFYK